MTQSYFSHCVFYFLPLPSSSSLRNERNSAQNGLVKVNERNSKHIAVPIQFHSHNLFAFDSSCCSVVLFLCRSNVRARQTPCSRSIYIYWKVYRTSGITAFKSHQITPVTKIRVFSLSVRVKLIAFIRSINGRWKQFIFPCPRNISAYLYSEHGQKYFHLSRFRMKCEHLVKYSIGSASNRFQCQPVLFLQIISLYILCVAVADDEPLYAQPIAWVRSFSA